MSKQGTLAFIDREQSSAAIRTGADEYTIVELDIEQPMDVGDAIEWENDDALGFEIYLNRSKNIEYEVFVQNHSLDEGALRLQFAV